MNKLLKPYTLEERVNFIVENNHNNGLRIEETETALYALKDCEILQNDEIIDISNDPMAIEQIQKAKEIRLSENQTKRDVKLLSGVTYKNILFDSDTDQKSNLMFAVASMDDTETITWYGMNNDSLECKKSDLLAIGQLIQELTSYVWGDRNPQYVSAINNAATIDELNAINIEY